MKKTEVETIITFSKASKEAHIWTNDIKIIRKMEKLEAIKKDENNFIIPINFIHLYKPRGYTKRQQEITKMLLKQNNPKINTDREEEVKSKKQPKLFDLSIWNIK